MLDKLSKFLVFIQYLLKSIISIISAVQIPWISLQLNLPVRPLLVGDHLSYATTYQKLVLSRSQITAFDTSRKRPPLVSAHLS